MADAGKIQEALSQYSKRALLMTRVTRLDIIMASHCGAGALQARKKKNISTNNNVQRRTARSGAERPGFIMSAQRARHINPLKLPLPVGIMISRSKSTPKDLDRLDSDIQGYPNRKTAILPRSRTAQTSLNSYFTAHPPWEAHEDPFNLSGFFPSPLTKIQTEWDWIKAEKPENDDVVSYPEEDLEDLRSVHEGPEGSYDERVRQVIDGEDKYGMLAFCKYAHSLCEL